MPHDRITATVLTGPEILTRVKADAWRSLAARAEDSPYFIQYEMVAGYLNHLRADMPALHDASGRHGEALAVLLERNGAPVGVIVLEPDTVQVSGLRLPALSMMVHPHAPQSDLLLDRREQLATFWPAIVSALSERGVRWEVMRSPGARTTSAAWRQSQSDAFKGRVVSTAVGHADYFDCTQTYAVLEARYGASLRRRLGQARRQLSRMGQLTFSCHASGTEGAKEAFEQFLVLEGAGWKGSQGTAIAQSVSLRQHYAQFFELDTPQAWAEVHLMKLDDKTIAAQFCIVSGGIREVVKLAYDETLRKQSPGNVMLDHMLQISCDDTRVSRFGLVGRPPWLAEWSPSSHDVHDVWVFRHRAIARLAVLSSRLKRSAIEFLNERLRRSNRPASTPAETDKPSPAQLSEPEPASATAPARKPVASGAPNAALAATPPAVRAARRSGRTAGVRREAQPELGMVPAEPAQPEARIGS